MTRPFGTAAALTLVLWTGAATAQSDGTLDPSFDLDGAVRIPFDYGSLLRDVPVAVAAQPDGKIVVAGTASVPGYGDNVAVTRLLANGAIDTGFGANGRAAYGYPADEVVGGMLVEPDGSILIAGTRSQGANPNPEVFLDRLSPLGFYVSGIAISLPGLDAPSVALARDPASGCIFVGFSYVFDGDHWFAVERRLTDLSPDESYGFFGRYKRRLPGSVPAAVVALAQLADGHLLVAGTAFGPGDSDLFVSSVTPQGAVEIAFGSAGTAIVPVDLVAGGDDSLRALAVDASGRILLSASAAATNYSDDAAVLVRLTGAGAPDPGFNGGQPLVVADTAGDDAMGGLAVQSDGKILVAGRVFAPSARFFAQRYWADGSADWSFGSFGQFSVNFPSSPDDDYAVALALQAGRPILVGPAEWSAPDYDFGVLRLTSALIFTDSFEGGSAGAWSSSTP